MRQVEMVRKFEEKERRTRDRLYAEISVPQGVVSVWINGCVDRGAGTGDRSHQEHRADVH